jgi:alkaline phosphatase D
MTYRLRRRDFLRGLVVVVAAAPLPACGSDDEGEAQKVGPIYDTDPTKQLQTFPQSIASGDPKPDSVILWTRALPASGTGPVPVKYEVATDKLFGNMVATGELTVDENTDHTLRVKVTELSAFKVYYYRFVVDGVSTATGRTKTAPRPDQDVAVKFAFASCQDFVGRYYHSWAVLTEEEPALDFVLFLGDYVYETNGDPDFQESSSNRKIEIQDGISLIPSDPDVKAASSLADYRGLYKQYRSDANLKRAHELYPFIAIWDDHEFANDCWQDHSTDFNDEQGDEKNPTRREAASQAWFEYQPADVPFDADAAYPNDITIYRSLRYGKHVELFLTDQRSYRSDHAIPEGAFGSEKPNGAGADVPSYDAAGKLGRYQSIGSRNFVKKAGFDPIEAFVNPTMLGATQKDWLVGAITASDASWKIWGNETQLIQMLIDISPFDVPVLFKGVYYFTVDQWDGFRTERKEILTELASVENLVALTGDIHAFYAGELHVDFDNPGPKPIGVEYVTAGISSSPVQEITAVAVLSLDPPTTECPTGCFGLADLVPQFDQILTKASPHYNSANSKAHGVAVIEVDKKNEIRVHFFHIADVKTEAWDGTFERVSFRTASGSNVVEPA